MQATFIEQDCAIEHEGKSFSASGAWLCDCTDGYRRGVVYARPITGNRGEVTDWHGNKIADAHFGHTYQGNFCRMQCVTFQHAGVRYIGRYCPDTAQAVRVRSTCVVSNHQGD